MQKYLGNVAGIALILTTLCGDSVLAQVENGGLSNGPDVVLSDAPDGRLWGAVGGKFGYSFGSHTCNIGDVALEFGTSFNRSPALAMNAYRMMDGRLVQIGASWIKGACCAAQSNGCGLGCVSASGRLGAGCLDVYSAGWNGGQSRMGPRSAINAFTGEQPFPPSDSGDAIHKRLQIEQADIVAGNDVGAMFLIEGVYVGRDDAPAGNALNNASYKRTTLANGGTMSPTGPMVVGEAAIYAWRDHGLGVNMPDPSVTIVEVDVPSEGRFVAGYKVTDNLDGTWTYDYAVFNLNSDRAGGSFSVPVPASANITGIGFHDVNRHSGEPIDSTDWIVDTSNGAITWASPQTHAQNPASNYLEWGTMYNFWFTADAGPEEGDVTLGLFKPGTPDSVSFTAAAPAGGLLGDMNCDGLISVSDIGPFVLALTDPAGYALQLPNCDINNGDINGDDLVSVGDIGAFVALLTN
ncbi:MAG: hypothetical protein AB7N71_03115 [Phycisphaerae bacterium]